MITILHNQRYQLYEELGRGSMGTVYRGYDKLLEREVLVKVLNESRLDEAGKERLLREARAMARLDHPNIVSVYDASEADGIPFIIMQYFAGKNLHEIGSLELPQALEITLQVCRALEHAHSQGIIHRDIKPENVIVAQDGEYWTARLTDFGLARSLASRKTAEGTIIGTVFYMAPEQALGQSVDARVDLYALGVMLYELVTGRLPFEGDDPLAVLSQHIHAEPTPPGSLNPNIPPALDALILRLLSKRSEDRPASAVDVRVALEAIVGATRPGRGRSAFIDGGSPLHNLPTALSSFIGREKESADVQCLLHQTRLLTLSGVGGTGKTRLALHCAAQALDEYEHGVWLVELARLTDPGRILPMISMVFNLYEGKEGIPLQTRLLHHLHDKRLLLILDNCEHLIEAAAQQVESILRTAPQVKVLVTSREALGLEGETIYLTPALSLPDTEHLPALDQLSHYDAVQLFVERAKAALPAFTLTEANAADVVQICQRLDGIPLAIELAAARVKALSTQQILARLSDRFRLLTGGSRTALPRQQTLRATIDWSYGLLSPPEQALLRSLSVFMGGFTLEAAEAVCACEGIDVLDGLGLLVNKSLVEAEVEGGEVHRYHLLETVRQYAQEKLDEAGESPQSRDRHLMYYLRVSKRIEEICLSFTGWGKMQRLRIEINNFRAAMSWAYGSSESARISEGLQIAINLKAYFQHINLYHEGLNWLKKGLAQLDKKDDQFLQTRAKAFYCAADLATTVDYNIEAGNYARESVNLFRKCQTPELPYLAHVLEIYAMLYNLLEPKQPKEFVEAESKALLQEALDTLIKSGTPWDLFANGRIKCQLAIDQKDYAAAQREIEHFTVILQRTDFTGFENLCLGQLYEMQGDYQKGLTHYQKALKSARQLPIKLTTCIVLTNIGNCAMQLTKIELAQEYYEELMSLAQEIGAKGQFTFALRKLAEICLQRGQYQQVGEHLEQGLTLAPEMDPDIFAIQCLFPLLNAAEGISQPESRTRLLGYMNKVVEDYNIILVSMKEKYQQITSMLQASLSPDVFQSSLEAGCKLSIEQVQAEALAIARQVAEAGKL